MSTFRVVALEHTYTNDAPLELVIFTSGRDGGWRKPAESNISLSSPTDELINFLGRANGALYWATGDGGGGMLVLDAATLECWESKLPDDVMGTGNRRDCRVIGGAEDDGALRVVCVRPCGATNSCSSFRRAKTTSGTLRGPCGCRKPPKGCRGARRCTSSTRQ